MLRIGTCSWKYDSRKGIIYPDKEEVNFLEEYTKQFNTVEVDQWFWSLFEPKKAVLPKDSNVKLYAKSVPDDFKFIIKIPNSVTLTHFYNKSKTEELKPNPFFLNTDLFEKFLETLKPMKKNIGVLMFQFEYLNKQKTSGLTEFLDRFESFVESIDKKYLDESWIRSTTSTGVDFPYGYGWRLEKFNDIEAVYHTGSTKGFRNIIYRMPEKKFTIVILTNRDAGSEYNTLKFAHQMIDYYFPVTKFL